MRRILVDIDLEKKVALYYTNLFSGRNANFVKPLDGLKNLYNKLGKIKHKKHREYIDTIITKYEDIIKADSTKTKDLIKLFDKIGGGVILDQKINKSKEKFWEQIVKAMRYEDLRSSEFHHYIEASGIKSCVYCNSQLCVVVDFTYYDKKEKKLRPKRMSKFELDHYYPKSKYPFLCTSFYNLYPVCGNCNKAKSNSPLDFELYTDDNSKLEIFKFWLDNNSILNYWITLNFKNLKVHFESVDGDFDFLNYYKKMFAIQGIYDTQIDIAEELVHKAKVYSLAYNKSLVDNFKLLFPDKSILERLIVGNYASASEIHKRPMAKYSQDIARQLKLIK
ncbi:hypothetical protein [Flavobacterium sp.]|uniref:hypothetical protein n=1 Tax=Flavobacterium sp. TaxID=239 RepID=UPI00248736F8|nr:hypothetical protein [Flavobacterium sp.]MDI1318092.1 hypothetical protein [Flavobacterium sp.]